MRRRTHDLVTAFAIGKLVALTSACSAFAGSLQPVSDTPDKALQFAQSWSVRGLRRTDRERLEVEAPLRIDRLFGAEVVRVTSKDSDDVFEVLSARDVHLALPTNASYAELEANPLQAIRPDSPPTDEVRYESGHGVGLTAGATSGVGFAYRIHSQNKWGFHVGGIAFGDSDSLFASLGMNAMLTLSKSEAARFYVLAGAATFFSRDKSKKGRRNEYDILVGAGIGMEINLTQELSLAIELPISAIFEYDDDGFDWDGVYPIPNVALIYYF